MKNIIHCLTFALAILVLVVSGCTQVEAERSTLRNADAEWSNVTGAKDVDGYVAAVAENGSILPPNTPILTGSEAIRQSAAEMMANPGFALGWKPTTVEVSTAGDLGYIVGTYESTLQDVQGNLVTDRGKYVTVWKKQPDGKWKVVADIFNSDLPAPTAGLSESDETAIRQLLQEFSAAAETEEVHRIGRFFTDDAVLMPQNGAAVEGRTAIQAWFTVRAIDFDPQILEVNGNGDFAYVRATYTLALDVEGFTPYRGKFLAVMRKQADGSWLISHYASSCSSDCG